MVFRYVIALCLVGAALADYCFDQKCRNFDSTRYLSYIDCDQEKYYCLEGTSLSRAKCGVRQGKGQHTHTESFSFKLTAVAVGVTLCTKQ